MKAFLVTLAAVLFFASCGNQVCVMGHLGDCDLTPRTPPPPTKPTNITRTALTLAAPVATIALATPMPLFVSGGKPPYVFSVPTTSSGAGSGTIDANGVFRGTAKGATLIRVTDSVGAVKEVSVIVN